MSTARPSEAASSGPSRLQFRLLGPLEASRDGVRLDLGPRKQRAVLALLLLSANRVVSTERLIDDLWGDAPPDTARSALQVYVAGLRKALGADGASLRTRSPGYVLELEPGALDLDRFLQLRTEARASGDDRRKAELLHEALALWRDTPLAELRAEPFSPSASAHLEQLRLEALEDRIDADLALGRHAAVVPELDALVAEHPYRERLRAQLMRALYASGRQADALEAYQAARRALNDDLGLKPGKELRELQAAILRQDEGLVEDEPRPVTVLYPGTVPPPSRRVARLRWPALLLAAVVAALVVAGAAAWLRADPTAVAVAPNSLAVIHPETHRVVDSFAVGVRPGPIAFGAGSVWVGDLQDKTLSRVDPRTRRIVKTIPLPATPTAITFGAGAVWVLHGLTGQLSRVDPQFGQVTTVRVTGKSLYYSGGGVAVGAGWVWAVYGDSTLARLEPADLRRSGSALAGTGPTGVVVEAGSIWVLNAGDATVQRFDPASFAEGPLSAVSVGRSAVGMAGGEGALWVAAEGDDAVTRIDTGSRSTFTIPVGREPTAVAIAAGAVWVTNKASGTLSRIDPATNDVTDTVEVSGAPSAIVLVNGALWVTVQAP